MAPAPPGSSSFPQSCSGHLAVLLLSSGQLDLPKLHSGRLSLFILRLEDKKLWPQPCLAGFFSSCPSQDSWFFPSLAWRSSCCPFSTHSTWIYPCPAQVALYAPAQIRVASFVPALLGALSFLPVLLRASCSAPALAPLGVAIFASATAGPPGLQHHFPGTSHWPSAGYNCHTTASPSRTKSALLPSLL